MRVECPHCHQKSVITHSRHNGVSAELYCTCGNPECAARFVMQLSYSHDLTPPASQLLNSLYEQVAGMPTQDRRHLLETFRDDFRR